MIRGKDLLPQNELYMNFDNPSKIETWGNEHYGRWAEKYKKQLLSFCLTANEKMDDMVIEGYCGNEYRHVNEYLRYKEMHGLYDEYSERMIRQLKTVMLSAPVVPENIIVYRSVGNHIAKELIKVGVANDKAFISTSMLRIVAEDYHNYSKQLYLLKVYVKKGVVGIYTPCVADGGEYELLLLCNGTFNLLQKPYYENGKTVFECQLNYNSDMVSGTVNITCR